MAKAVPQPAPEYAQAPRPFRDISARVPGYRFRTVLDVGAQLGQSCLPVAQSMPEVRIYALEPVARVFEKLRESVAEHPQIEPLNLALGARTELGAFGAPGTAMANRLVLPASPARPNLAQALGRLPGGAPLEPEPPRLVRVRGVEIVTGADFCRDRGIDHISFLRIDTEGHDLEVIRGFGETLDIADFVQVQAGTNPYNRTHVSLGDFQTVLGRAGFHLFRIYGEAFEFKGGGRPVSRRCNPVFIHRRLAGDMEGID